MISINEISIGDEFTDIRDGSISIVINLTSSSVELYITRKSEDGINCSNWFTIENFNKIFNKSK